MLVNFLAMLAGWRNNRSSHVVLLSERQMQAETELRLQIEQEINR